MHKRSFDVQKWLCSQSKWVWIICARVASRKSDVKKEQRCECRWIGWSCNSIFTYKLNCIIQLTNSTLTFFFLYSAFIIIFNTKCDTIRLNVTQNRGSFCFIFIFRHHNCTSYMQMILIFIEFGFICCVEFNIYNSIMQQAI